MKREKFQKPIDIVIKEAKLKEEARQSLKRSQEKVKEFENVWNRFYKIGE